MLETVMFCTVVFGGVYGLLWGAESTRPKPTAKRRKKRKAKTVS